VETEESAGSGGKKELARVELLSSLIAAIKLPFCGMLHLSNGMRVLEPTLLMVEI
jgi:hypothetical protein